MKNGISTDEDKNPNAHGEGTEHLHPLRVTMLFQEPRESAPSLLRGCTCMQKNMEGTIFNISSKEQFEFINHGAQKWRHLESISETDITVSLVFRLTFLSFVHLPCTL